LKSNSIRGAGVSVQLNVKQVIQIGRVVGLKSFVVKRDNLILKKDFISHTDGNLSLTKINPVENIIIKQYLNVSISLVIVCI